MPLALDILSDILTKPTFDQAELERERQVVLQEIGQARDTPDDIIFDHLQATIYPNQPMGWPILGEDDTVSNFSQQDLRTYMGANYLAGSMVLVSSGAVTHEEMVRLAEEKLSRLHEGRTIEPLPARWIGGERRESDDLEQAHMAFAFPGLKQTDPEIYALQVYVTALGGGMSSRLFQEVREKRGLCYTISAFAQAAEDSGVVAIYTGTGEAEPARSRRSSPARWRRWRPTRPTPKSRAPRHSSRRACSWGSSGRPAVPSRSRARCSATAACSAPPSRSPSSTRSMPARCGASARS